MPTRYPKAFTGLETFESITGITGKPTGINYMRYAMEIQIEHVVETPYYFLELWRCSFVLKFRSYENSIYFQFLSWKNKSIIQHQTKRRRKSPPRLITNNPSNGHRSNNPEPSEKTDNLMDVTRTFPGATFFSFFRHTAVRSRRPRVIYRFDDTATGSGLIIRVVASRAGWGPGGEVSRRDRLRVRLLSGLREIRSRSLLITRVVLDGGRLCGVWKLKMGFGSVHVCGVALRVLGIVRFNVVFL